MSILNSALEEIMQLDYNLWEMILEILKKRQIEARREEIAKKARKSIRDYQNGKTPAKSLSETLDHLENF